MVDPLLLGAGVDPINKYVIQSQQIVIGTTWNAKCPIFLGNFTPKTSNYCLKNRALGFPGTLFKQTSKTWRELAKGESSLIVAYLFDFLLAWGW